jgi:mRNA-degrading endonuclease YafQ of YafQ-DinJ toxin-antitoxin module
MAGSITEIIRQYINLVTESLDEGKLKQRQPQQPVTAPPSNEFGVVQGKHFEDSLKRCEKVFPDLREKLKKFLTVKRDDPLRSRYGKHDGPFATGTPLAGYMHCHLRDDAILIYTLKNRNINLLLICNHADIEGKRQVRTGALLAA